MPELVRKSGGWHEKFQIDIKEIAKGWSVQDHRGKVLLKVRVKGQKAQSVKLDFLWEKGSSKQAEIRIRNIYNLTLEGHDLKTASKIADGKAPKIERDWTQCLKNFQQFKTQHENAITEKTFNHDYSSVLIQAVSLLESINPPTNPPDLIDLCIRDWKPGTATRKRRTNNLCQFLEYCVTRENAPASWLPPKDRKIHIGRKTANAKTQKKDPITDQEILNLIEQIESTAAGVKWANALKLIAEYGLRPVEIKHLHVRTDNKTNEEYLWCSYEKRSGGGITKPRRLEPLPIENTQWNLLPLLKIGRLQLPSLTAKGNGVAELITKYLNRRSCWASLKAKVESRNEQLGTYSLRHSYSVRGHSKYGIDSGAMSNAMGHSLECHLREYPFATTSTTESTFKKARNKVRS
jgi:integrase